MNAHDDSLDQLVRLKKPTQTEPWPVHPHNNLTPVSATVSSSPRLFWADSIIDGVLNAAAIAQRERAEGRLIRGLPTTIPALDRVLNGLSPRGLHVLGGAPAVGKTSLALQIALAAAHTQPTLYLTYENTPENLVLKAVCRLAGLQPSSIERGRADMTRMAEGARVFGSLGPRMSFVEGTSDVTLDLIQEWAQQVVSQHDAAGCLVVVDYLQRLAVHQSYGSMSDNIWAVSLGLRDIAARLNSPVLVISSLLPDSNYEGPGLRDLHGSGELQFAADAVLLLGTRQEISLSSKSLLRNQVGVRLLDLFVAKNRYGEATQRIPLIFRPAFGDFQEDSHA